MKKNILNYYILVNDKNNFKFIENTNNKFRNPGIGLLVIGGVANKNFV